MLMLWRAIGVKVPSSMSSQLSLLPTLRIPSRRFASFTMRLPLVSPTTWPRSERFSVSVTYRTIIQLAINFFCILSWYLKMRVFLFFVLCGWSADDYRHPALLLVDGVSSICALDFRMDEWGVDVALTGSQKALSLPTGLGIVCASPKALEAAKTAKSYRVFFDWSDYLKFYKMGTYWPYTPSIQLLYGLRAALDLLFEEGLDNVIARHARLGKATRLAVEAWGLKNCTQKEEWVSDTVTAVMVPPYIDSAEIVRRAWKRYNLSLGLGLNKVAGKVFRIGHLGNLNELQLLGCLAGVEMILKDVGYPVKLGSGVAAASAYLQNAIPLIPSRI
ncbi:unnamed protein product [Linum tenue]|uniref:Aminotransferase class V domain-containing protein n=1 Tax=Linum tenue TaxID=586396 RepID=A0AAV0QC65_9ROSI|nr:unnamed protein product [Linum tenue]